MSFSMVIMEVIRWFSCLIVYNMMGSLSNDIIIMSEWKNLRVSSLWVKNTLPCKTKTKDFKGYTLPKEVGKVEEVTWSKCLGPKASPRILTFRT